MTVLKDYVRLETPGLWREGAGAQRRGVVVQLGDASLTFLDERSGIAVSHWSLPAVRRLNPGDLPALYSPGADEGETIEIDEPAMIDAIERVRAAIDAARPRPGRLRLGVLAASVGVLAVLGALWLPRALAGHAASVMPAAARAEIGRAVLADLARVTGAPCTGSAGQRAGRRLAERLFGPGGGEVVVVRDGIGGALQLPGRLMVIDLRTLTARDAPELAAAHILAARMRAEAQDPVVPILRWAGVAATLKFLTTNALPREAVAGYGAHAAALTPRGPDPVALIARAAEAGIDLGPYAASRPADTALQTAVDANPIAAREVLADGDWIALQSVCDV
jgi:hypothetical protein